MLISNSLKSRVSAGLEWLDANLFTTEEGDWWERINLEKLDISDRHWCICGQLGLMNDSPTGVARSIQFDWKLGFFPNLHEKDGLGQVIRLTELWKEEIRGRLGDTFID